MKAAATYAVAALVAGAAAQPHNHGHRHIHAKKREMAALENRADASVCATVVPTTTDVYVLEGSTIAASDAVAGISSSLYIVVGETTPTFTPPPPPSSTSTSSVSTKEAAQFMPSKAKTTTAAAAAATGTATPQGTGLDADFPSGTIPCSQFPSQFGPIPINWLNTGGWTSIQVPTSGYTPGLPIANIMAPISGTCYSGAFCSYSCPPGYQKSQWPDSQGASGQSIGGLYCNAQGFLELTRPSHPKLCEPGAGGVYIQNNLGGNCAVCRTDYPASEAMVIPLNTLPGGNYPVTNVFSPDYYMWEDKPTTAQYYVNPLNISPEHGCLWTSPVAPLSAGNWAPTILGVGKDSAGITYISIFANAPTSTAVLDFDIEITGDVSIECTLKSGVYSGPNNGCTTALTSGKATIIFKHSGS